MQISKKSTCRCKIFWEIISTHLQWHLILLFFGQSTIIRQNEVNVRISTINYKNKYSNVKLISKQIDFKINPFDFVKSKNTNESDSSAIKNRFSKQLKCKYELRIKYSTVKFERIGFSTSTIFCSKQRKFFAQVSKNATLWWSIFK